MHCARRKKRGTKMVRGRVEGKGGVKENIWKDAGGKKVKGKRDASKEV